MNDYLSALRSMMPPSYVQRGDQASIVGGAINFVKELEQLLQSLEAHKRIKKESTEMESSSSSSSSSSLFSYFFTFPQYSTSSDDQSTGKKRSAIKADVEVTMVESHANLKILIRRQPKQLLKIVGGLYSLCLGILHINVTTTVDHMVLYSFSVKAEEECQLTSVNEIATAVYEMVGRIQDQTVPNIS
ncbi:DNA binding protein, putative [Ricinus communis]|uniref:DNA binding protein, putative n=1 Tax=Ricinus communis TaxID=3988 RepID=B9TLL7_RICCO|nr:DNA binding protein, putative [Ricinus communis]